MERGKEFWMRVDWRMVMVGGMMGVMATGVMVGCSSQPTAREGGSRMERVAREGDERAFAGTIISLRPTVSTMLISKDEQVGKEKFPNVIAVKYDAGTKIFVDGREGTITDLERYMPVQVRGRMKDGAM